MNRSLSVLLPVHNSQSTLAANVADVLEILPDLADQFELLIIDDGSSDGTGEIAQDLARRFPQISVIRQPRRTGPAQAIQAGVRRSNGDMVIVHDGQPGIDAGELARLWNSSAAIPPAFLGSKSVPGLGRTLFAEKAASPAIPRTKMPGFQVLRAGAVEELRRVAAGGPSSDTRQPLPGPVVRHGVSPAKRPNFLSRFKDAARDFARGE